MPPPEELFEGLPLGDGNFDFRMAPWARAVLDWWMDDRVSWIYLVQASQTSKTTTMLGLLLWAARYDPGPTLFVGPVEDEVDKFVVQRLKPFLEHADPATRTARKVDWRKQDIRIYGRMLCHFAWSTSARKLRSWPARYIFGDEFGVWPANLPDIGDPLAYVLKRTRRYRRRKGLFCTTPTTEDHPSWKTAAAANFAQWHVPCPRCGTMQFLDFERIRFDQCREGDGWNLSRIETETFYECIACCAHLTDVDKPEMIRGGRIVFVDAATMEPVDFDPANPSCALHVPSTYSLHTSWASLARMFLAAKRAGRDALRIFINDELARPWIDRPPDAPTVDAVLACIDGDRPPGAVPDDAIAITCGVDVQRDRIYYVLRAWGRDERSWGIRHGVLPRDPDGGLRALNPILSGGRDGVAIDFCLIDSGYHPEAVYAFCRQEGRSNVAPAKGASGQLAELVKVSPIDRHHGRALRGGMQLYLVNTGHFKRLIHDRLAVRRGDPREWRLHNETDANYCRQILSESLVTTHRGGRLIQEWKVTDKTAGNHYLDAEVLAAAAAWYPVAVHRYEPVEIVTDYFAKMRRPTS